MSTTTSPSRTAPALRRPAGSTTVTATFVRLKFALLRNGLRQSTGRTLAFVTSIVLALLLAAGQLLGLILLRGHQHAADVALTLTGLLALGWVVMPLFFPSGDETLDPSRLVMLPLRPRQLVVSLLAASLVGIGPLFTLALAAGAVVSPARGAAGWAAALCALPLVMLTCVALARAVAAANVRLLTSRKGRDLALLSGLVIAVGVQVVNLGVQKLSGAGGLSALEPAADVLRWVPPASAIAAVDEAGEGSYALALTQLLLAAAALAALLWWWQRSLTRLMTTPDASTLQAATVAPRSRTGGGARGIAALLPGGRTGAVMQRTLRYAWRDPKTKVSWASTLGVGILVPVVMAVQGNGSVYHACWVSGLFGVQMYNQFGQDYSGFWLVASTISGRRDAYAELRGRMLAIALFAVPYVALVAVVSAALLGSWAVLPEVLGLALALLGIMLATGAVSSVAFAYSIPQDSHKNVAPGQGSLAYLSILGGMLTGTLLASPLLALTIWLHVTDAHGWLWLILPLGIGYGAAAAALALRIAAPRAASRLPEILTAVSRG